MPDYSLDDAYSEAQELEEKVDQARNKVKAFLSVVEDGEMSDLTADYLSKPVESYVEIAHETYTELNDKLHHIEQIREQVSTPENIMEEAEDRYLEDELDQGRMSEVMDHFDISIDPVEKPPENPEETVRYVMQSLREYEAVHTNLDNMDYDFDLPEVEFADDTGEIIDETAEKTINRDMPEKGEFFSEK